MLYRILPIITFSIFLLNSAFAEEEITTFEGVEIITFEEAAYKGFKTVKSFGFVSVSIMGDARKIGLKEDELSNYLRLKFKNNFADIPYKKASYNDKIFNNKEQRNSIGSIHIKVWTIGDDYPIAYHLSIRAGNYTDFGIYTNAILGYGSKENVPETVKKLITELVEELAISFFKARGALWKQGHPLKNLSIKKII